MSDDILNIDATESRRNTAYNLIVDVFLTATWTEALAHAMNLLTQRHPDKPSHELLSLILVNGICSVIDEERRVQRRRQSDFKVVAHG